MLDAKNDGGDDMPFLIFQSLGPAELIIILAIVVVLFGASRIGDIGGALGKGIREFRREVKEGEQPKEKEPAATEGSEEKKV
jgi:sec-independent protein translocase protein TatA